MTVSVQVTIPAGNHNHKVSARSPLSAKGCGGKEWAEDMTLTGVTLEIEGSERDENYRCEWSLGCAEGSASAPQPAPLLPLPFTAVLCFTQHCALPWQARVRE